LDLDKPPHLPELALPEVLEKSVSIKGTVVSHQDLYIDGEIEGSIEAVRSMVTVGPNATLAASIKALKVIVLGKMQGPVTALDSVELRRNCELVGNVRTSRIMIEDGCLFQGIGGHLRADR
jgi:cytoskeletal protein CcmA (bactofilin family)